MPYDISSKTILLLHGWFTDRVSRPLGNLERLAKPGSYTVHKTIQWRNPHHSKTPYRTMPFTDLIIFQSPRKASHCPLHGFSHGTGWAWKDSPPGVVKKMVRCGYTSTTTMRGRIQRLTSRHLLEPKCAADKMLFSHWHNKVTYKIKCYTQSDEIMTSRGTMHKNAQTQNHVAPRAWHRNTSTKRMATIILHLFP